MLSNDGSVFLIDIDDIADNVFAIGTFTISAFLSEQLLQGADLNASTANAKDLLHSVSIPAATNNRVGFSSEAAKLFSFASGCLSVSRNYLVVAGLDGAVRVFDHSLTLGYDDSRDGDANSSVVGLTLRARRPYVDKNAAVVVQVKSNASMSTTSRSQSASITRRSSQKNSSTTTASSAKSNAQDSSVLRPQSAGRSTTKVSTKDAITAKRPGVPNISDSAAKMPVFELANLTNYEKRVNTNKLRLFLNKNGSRYQDLILLF